MSTCRAFGCDAASQPIHEMTIPRRAPLPNDVVIDVMFCGICHSDLHQVRDEWGGALFPMVPGHEVVGKVVSVGAEVGRFRSGDLVGVGCMVDSCRACRTCQRGLEQYCVSAPVLTYNNPDPHKTAASTYGGYSETLVCREEFVFRMPTNLDAAASAPLLCAGITTYSPLKKFGVTEGTRVGVVGLGGLGHMAVQFAKAMGAKVTVFTTSASKVEEAKALGADRVVLSKDAKAMGEAARSLDFIVDCVAAEHEMTPYLNALDFEGEICIVGAPPGGSMGRANAFDFIMGRRRISGSLIGGVPETQEMLDFCGKHGIACKIETITAAQINDAYERMLRGDVKYRFVIDLKASLK